MKQLKYLFFIVLEFTKTVNFGSGYYQITFYPIGLQFHVSKS